MADIVLVLSDAELYALGRTCVSGAQASSQDKVISAEVFGRARAQLADLTQPNRPCVGTQSTWEERIQAVAHTVTALNELRVAITELIRVVLT